MKGKISVHRLHEKLSYNDLFRVSDPRRVVRSLTVKGPPLEIDAYKDSMYYGFNFKAHPSTTGLRHKGYVKFIKPQRVMPLGRVPCEVDCDCPDMRFRWAWANKQRGSGRVGPNSLNQAHNRAPRVTNPGGRPGLCKHILAVKDYIEGQMSDKDFIGNEPEGDASVLLNKLVKRSQKVWVNYPETMQKAREREQQLARMRMLRNQGIDPNAEPGHEDPDPEDPAGTGGIEDPGIEDPGDDEQPPPAPPGGNMPPLPPMPDIPAKPSTNNPDKKPKKGPKPPKPPTPPKTESVGNNVKSELERSIRVIEEMEAEIEASGFENSVTGDCPEEEKSPGDQVLALLKSIDSSLKELSVGEEPDLDEEPIPDMDMEIPDMGDDEDEEEGPSAQDSEKLNGV